MNVPSKVSFLDPNRLKSSNQPDEYCFNLAMAGWASGALCVNLTDGVDDEDPEGDVRSTIAKGKEREKVGFIVVVLLVYFGMLFFQNAAG